MKTDFQWTKRLAPRDGPILFLAQLLLAFSAILWIFLETEELRFLIGEDFPQDYVASELWLEGRSVYGPEVADRARTSCGFDGIKNFHPPTDAILFLPLQRFSCRRAYYVAGSTYLFLCAGILLLLGSSVFGARSAVPFIFLNFFAFSGLVGDSVRLGNSSLAIISLLFLSFLFLRKDREVSAGLCVGMACGFKLFPGLYALFFLLSGRWKAFFATVLTVSGLFAAYSIRGSVLDFPIYFQIIARENVIHWGALPSGISIASLVSPLFLDSIHTKAPFPNEQLGLAIHQGVLLVGLFLFSLHARKLVSAGKTQLGFVLTGLYMILISPISWPHIAPFLVFSGVVISQAAHQQEGWTAKWLVPLGLSFLVLLPPHDAIFELLTRLSGGGPPDDRSLLLVLAKPGMYATMAQLAIVTWIGSQSPSKDESGSGSMLPTPGERQDIPG